MQHLNWIVPVVGLIGFLFAVVTRAQVIKQDPGTEKMRVKQTRTGRVTDLFLIRQRKPVLKKWLPLKQLL